MKPETRIKAALPVIVLTSAAILLSVVIVNSGLIKGRTQGSFEYVRRADALLDKGRYTDAIKLYEKALDSSPESEDIRDGLIYAYSRYAAKKAESEEYDTAIEYLSKARDLVQSTYTRQNLSLMYAARALSGVRKSEWAAAQEDLRLARDISSGSAACERSLGITLFNNAVGEHKAAKDDAALLLLREAALVYPDSRIYEFLGDVYYRRTELDRARFYLDKASGLDPDNRELSEKRDKVIKESALSADERTEELPYFEIRYDKGLPVDTAVVSRILEKAYHEVGRDLSYFPGRKTVVFFYSEGDFRELFKMPDVVRAFYDGNIRIPLPASISDEKELASYLYHEYAHAVISAKTNNNCPVWLSEGIAVYEEIKRTRPGASIAIRDDATGPADISVAALDKMFAVQGSDPLRLAAAYILAYTAVDYMVDNRGMDGLNEVLKSIAAGRHAVNAIDDEYLLSEKEFNGRWSDFVMRKYVKKGG